MLDQPPPFLRRWRLKRSWVIALLLITGLGIDVAIRRQKLLQKRHNSWQYEDWYSAQIYHWDKKARENGLNYDCMVGGTGLSAFDVRDSRHFLEENMPFEILVEDYGPLVALDCGAGIGRITRELLLHYFAEVDILEPSQVLIEEAKRLLQPPSSDSNNLSHPDGYHVANYFQIGLQEHPWHLYPQRYDAIWLQWAIDKLTDQDAVTMLINSRISLKSTNSVVFLKENICPPHVCDDQQIRFFVDDEPTITRTLSYLLTHIIKPSGYEVVNSAVQSDFYPESFPVMMMSLRASDDQY